MKSDIEIAQEAKMKPIAEVAASLGLADEDVIPYGRYKAKINHRLIHKATKQGKMILVTAISPTPAGEGKTTTSVGLADAMNAAGQKDHALPAGALPGPCVRHQGRRGRRRLCPGGAHGGHQPPLYRRPARHRRRQQPAGRHDRQPASSRATPLNIDPRRITWKRCMDMNDRQLRFIVDGLGGKVNGAPREDGFDITVASEVMAIFCLATSI